MSLGETPAIDPPSALGIEEAIAPTVPNDLDLDLDLDAIEQDLADVEIALDRLQSGTYRTCEITGRPLGDELLAANPTTRRLPSP